MMLKQKKLNILGLATRAGLLVTGDEQVEKAIKKQSVTLVFCGNDASDATKKRYESLCEAYDCQLITAFSSVDISQAIGKKRMICALGNRGMIKKYFSYEENDEEH